MNALHNLSHKNLKKSWNVYDDCLYGAILLSWADSLRSHVILHEWLAFYNALFEQPQKWCPYTFYSAGMAGATWNCCPLGASSVYTIQPCTMSLHAKPHMYGGCMFSCNLPPALLAEWLGSFTSNCGKTGWNGYQNKSQRRKLTLEKNLNSPAGIQTCALSIMSLAMSYPHSYHFGLISE